MSGRHPPVPPSGAGEYFQTGRHRTIQPHENMRAPEGLRTSTPVALGAETSAVLEALHAALPGALAVLERSMKAEINLAMNGAVGAQRSLRETVLERRLTKWKALAGLIGTAAGIVVVALGGAVAAYQRYTNDTVEVVAPVIEAKAAPLEQRMTIVEDQQEAMREDLVGLGRKVDGFGRTLGRIEELLERDETPQARKRPR